MIARHYGLGTGDQALILDLLGGDAAVFLIRAEQPDASPGPENAPSSKDSQDADMIQVTRQALTAEQAEGSQALTGLIQQVDGLDAEMFGDWTCGPDLLESPELASQRRADLQQRWDQRIIPLHKVVDKTTGHESIHGLLGMDEAAQELAQAIAPPTEVLADEIGFSQPAHGDATDWPNVTLRLKFADGSQGLWRLEASNQRWVPDWTQFRDSDGNPIPLTADDMHIGMGFTFSSRSNLEWFLSHSAGMGIPVVREDDEAHSVTCVRDYQRLICRPGTARG